MKLIFILIIVSCFITTGLSQTTTISKDSSVELFYAVNKAPIYWLSSQTNIKRAEEWITAIEAAKDSGLVSRKILTSKVRYALLNKDTKDNTLKAQIDSQITSVVLDFIKELQLINVHFDYDEIQNSSSDSVFIHQLLNSNNKEPISKIISGLDCNDHDYLILKKFLRDSVPDKYSVKYKSIRLSMNYLKYLAANKRAEYIMVNIPETQLRYFRNGQLTLSMKAIVGRKKNQTPTIASHITNIVAFPCWNVPYSIATKELLPKIQKNVRYLEQNNFEVVDANGTKIDDSNFNWNSYTEKNLPFYFREASGSKNTLGVLKFNLQNPFSIYLHDTNAKGAFSRNYRFLSHGCIRLEKPIELADFLTSGRIDINALKNGGKDTEPTTFKTTQKVPVFIIYMPVIVNGGKVIFLKDEYGLVK